jgi:hypothetical protein
MLAAVACGYDASATFNADGSVTVGLQFLFPKSMMQGSSSTSVSGMTPADIAKANATLASKYPGAKVARVEEGTEVGVRITVPFKTEKDAFAFLTQPTTLNQAGTTSGAGTGVDLSNTGGLFSSATHTTSGQSDTYTFKTLPPSQPSSAPSQSPITADDLASIFSVTFSLTVPHEITSATGALFTLDRKTAIWKLSLAQAQTLTATTGPSTTVVGFAANSAQVQSPALIGGVGLAAIAIGFIIGMFGPWRRLFGQRVVPAPAPAADLAAFAASPPPVEAEPAAAPSSWSGPPAGTPPPTSGPGSAI